MLNGRRCGLPCAAQADCPDDYKCEPQWLGVEDDGQRYTRMITYDACVYAPGSDRICGGDADCDEGELMTFLNAALEKSLEFQRAGLGGPQPQSSAPTNPYPDRERLVPN